MSIVEIICLGGVIGAFVVFAVVLAWADYQTHDITTPIKRRRATDDTVATPLREPIHAA